MSDLCPSCTLNAIFLRCGSADVTCSLLLLFLSVRNALHAPTVGWFALRLIRKYVVHNKCYEVYCWPYRHPCIGRWTRSWFKIIFNVASHSVHCLPWVKNAEWVEIETCICIPPPLCMCPWATLSSYAWLVLLGVIMRNSYHMPYWICSFILGPFFLFFLAGKQDLSSKLLCTHTLF